jgi:hypothetical protein
MRSANREMRIELHGIISVGALVPGFAGSWQCLHMRLGKILDTHTPGAMQHQGVGTGEIAGCGGCLFRCEAGGKESWNEAFNWISDGRGTNAEKQGTPLQSSSLRSTSLQRLHRGLII